MYCTELHFLATIGGMSETRRTPTLLTIVRLLPMVALVAVSTAIIIRSGPGAITAQIRSLDAYSLATVAILMALFLLKSVSFGLPYTLLYLAIGHLYPLPIALLINTIGIVVNMQIPYLVGRYASIGFVDRLLERASFIQRFKGSDGQHPIWFAFLVKFIGVVPHEITNLMLGSLKVPWTSYVIGGVLGLLPGMLATTIAGSSIGEPTSIRFISSALVVVGLLALSVYLARSANE